jgi:ribonuclease T
VSDNQNASPVTPEYFVVDVEATGPELSQHSLIEIGAVRADNLEDRFHCFVKPGPDVVVDPWVKENIPHVVKSAQEQGLSVAAAAEHFRAWVLKCADGRLPVMVGYVMALDSRALNRLFEQGLGPGGNPFHYKTLDIYPYTMGVLGVPWGFPRESLDHWLSVEPMGDGEAHNALFDALQHAREFNALRKLQESRHRVLQFPDGPPLPSARPTEDASEEDSSAET